MLSRRVGESMCEIRIYHFSFPEIHLCGSLYVEHAGELQAQETSFCKMGVGRAVAARLVPCYPACLIPG